MISVLAQAAGRFGVNSREAERFLKFAVVGLIGFVVDFGIFNLLTGPLEKVMAPGTAADQILAGVGMTQGSALAPAVASTISFLAAVISNFVWNRYWTYPDSRSRSIRKQLAQFTLVNIVGIVIRIPLITFTHQPFARFAGQIPALVPYADRIGNNMALILAVVVVLFWNFFVNRYWTYNDVE
ncbi:MAG: GtrA family protein [Anaerolineae bacterium]